MSALMTVPFHGASLMLVEHEGQPYVPMRPMVEGMGLDWSYQYRKLNAAKRRYGVAVVATPSAGGSQETICIPLRKLPGWLSTLEPCRIKKKEAKEKVELFQEECDDALWQYWNDGHAENPRAAVREPINDPVIPPERQLPAAAESFDAAKRIAQGLGLEGNQAILSANRMVKGAIGVDVMQLAGVTHLVNEAQELNYTPTELGSRFGMTANQMNKLIADCGLQRHAEYAKGKKRWELLPDGKPFAVIIDSSKKHSDGAPVQQIRWKESVLGELKKLAHRLEAELPKRPGGGI